MNIEKMKKNAEIFSLFMEYQAEFLEWIETNKNNPLATYNYVDRWNGANYSSEDNEEEKKELPIIEFSIVFMFLDKQFPRMEILHKNKEVFRMVLDDSMIECIIMNVHDIVGI